MATVNQPMDGAAKYFVALLLRSPGTLLRVRCEVKPGQVGKEEQELHDEGVDPNHRLLTCLDFKIVVPNELVQID